MRHGRRRRKLGLVKEHRVALLRNLACGLVEHSRIQTTYARAKETSRLADKMITIAKKGTLHARRVLISNLNSQIAAKKLVDEIGPLFKEQNGGYTRVLRTRYRAGDGAQMALVEFTKILERPADEGKKKKKKKEKPEGSVEAPEKPAKPKKVKEEKPASPKKAPKAEQDTAKEKTEGKQEGQKEEPKKGGFLGNLRKFLTGD